VFFIELLYLGVLGRNKVLGLRKLHVEGFCLLVILVLNCTCLLLADILKFLGKQLVILGQRENFLRDFLLLNSEINDLQLDAVDPIFYDLP
jgi:hypothetical protein